MQGPGSATPEAAVGSRAAKDELHEAFARVGKALANPHRVEMLDLLAQAERSVESLAARADVSVALASAHLQTLRGLGSSPLAATATASSTGWRTTTPTACSPRCARSRRGSATPSRRLVATSAPPSRR